MLTNPEKECASKRKTNQAGHLSVRTTVAKQILVHGPGHSTKYCKVLKKYYEKYATQRTHQKRNPDLAATKISLRPSSLTVRRNILTPWYPIMSLSQERKRGEIRPKILRVRRMLQSLQRIKAMMVLTA